MKRARCRRRPLATTSPTPLRVSSVLRLDVAMDVAVDAIDAARPAPLAGCRRAALAHNVQSPGCAVKGRTLDRPGVTAHRPSAQTRAVSDLGRPPAAEHDTWTRASSQMLEKPTVGNRVAEYLVEQLYRQRGRPGGDPGGVAGARASARGSRGRRGALVRRAGGQGGAVATAGPAGVGARRPDRARASARDARRWRADRRDEGAVSSWSTSMGCSTSCGRARVLAVGWPPG